MNANAYNLARRLSVRNENDLLQEDLVSPPESPYSQEKCFDMISKVCPEHPLPLDCERFEVALELKRRNSDRSNQAIAFKGLSGPEAESFRVARSNGVLNHAQLQRRMTNPQKKW